MIYGASKVLSILVRVVPVYLPGQTCSKGEAAATCKANETAHER